LMVLSLLEVEYPVLKKTSSSSCGIR